MLHLFYPLRKPSPPSVSLVCELSGRVHTGVVRMAGGGVMLVVYEPQQYSASEMERMMKVQDVLLKATGRSPSSFSPTNWPIWLPAAASSARRRWLRR